MRTLTAILLHLGVGAMQVGGAYATSMTGSHPIPMSAQIPLQMALFGLQSWIAAKNSDTDPKGNPLVESATGQYVTAKK